MAKTETITTRFMIISDTHNFQFGRKKFPMVPFQHPLPKSDVLLHCGDLTMNGEVSELRDAVEMLGSIDAELKLVIAGNHDGSLDGTYWNKLRGGDDDDEHGDHARAMEAMTGEEAKEAGITYLEEGIHHFTLNNGAKFSIYASPYQPEFCGFAFPYERDEDRYNPPEHIKRDIRQIRGVKVPDFPGVEIMMTHGPPRGILDPVYEGKMTAHVGCDALMTAVSRARPLLYCFGHIHEGHGSNLVTWKKDQTLPGEEAIESQQEDGSPFPDTLAPDIQRGGQTLMVNAAIMDVHYKPNNAPFLVDLELPRA